MSGKMGMIMTSGYQQGPAKSGSGSGSGGYGPVGAYGLL